MSENNTSLEQAETEREQTQTQTTTVGTEGQPTQAGTGTAQPTTTAGQPRSIEEIQTLVFCNWCRNPLAMSGDEFTESNFIDTGKTWHDQPAQAVYCSECLQYDFRKDQPKSVLDRVTLQETRIENLL